MILSKVLTEDSFDSVVGDGVVAVVVSCTCVIITSFLSVLGSHVKLYPLDFQSWLSSVIKRLEKQIQEFVAYCMHLL